MHSNLSEYKTSQYFNCHVLVVTVSASIPVDGMLEHEHCRNTKVSQFSTLIITISLHSRKNIHPHVCYYSAWLEYVHDLVTNQ